MRSHKYIKRTGSKGSYRYWYRLPDGRVVASDDAASPVSHDKAKLEHVKRLVAGKLAGHHVMSLREISQHVGTPENQASNANANLGRRPHDFHESHMKEAVHEVPGTVQHEQHEREAAEATTSGAAAAPASPRPRRPRAPARTPMENMAAAQASGSARTPEAAAAETERDNAEHHARRLAERRAASTPGRPGRIGDGPAAAALRSGIAPAHTPAPAAPTAATAAGDTASEQLRAAGFREHAGGGFHRHVTHGSHRIVKVGDKWELHTVHDRLNPEGMTTNHHPSLTHAIEASKEVELHGVNEMARLERERNVAEAAAATPAPAAQTEAEKLKEMEDEAKRKWGLDFSPPPAPAPAAPAAPAQEPAAARQEAKRAARAAASASSPSAPAAEPMHAASPELAAADAPIARMEEAQANGENPYAKRAVEIYNNIKHEVDPARKAVVSHMIAAMNAVMGPRGEVNKAAWKAKYKELSGDGQFAKAMDHFESATFIDEDEIVGNKELDPEVERAKRGFSAMQYARLKPFLSSRYTEKLGSMGRDGPPPYPTYSDLKTWEEHGSPRPDGMGWTTPTGRRGGVQRAMPQEFFNSMPKGPDGKPMMPPDWLPLNLTPIWQYVVKKEAEPYASRLPSSNERTPTGGFAFKSQGQLGSHIHNAIRRYIQMRGKNDFVDIPKSKLSKQGLAHHDIYKALRSDSFVKFITGKIIDPIALQPFVEADMGVKKSFSLVVDEDAKPVVYKKGFTVDLKKAEIIRKIKELKAKR